MKVLISTTINVPDALTGWSNGLTADDWVIVAGDQKSPHKEIRTLLDKIMDDTGVNTMYLDPDHQMQWAMSAVTGWNCIQRRNIALLEAMKLQPEYIITVDDDNYPTTYNQIKLLESTFTPSKSSYNDIFTIASDTGWWNPAFALCAETPLDPDINMIVTHRGYPQSQRHVYPGTFGMKSPALSDVKVGVAAMLWKGDPDIDAIERIVNRPYVHGSNKNFVLAPGTWAPFNSQATMYRAELAPLMMVWPGVGRYDDIWASYLARCVMDYFGYSVYYGEPLVFQDRNEHDLIKDLKDEMFGMEHNEKIIKELRTCSIEEYAINSSLGRAPISIRQAMEFVYGYLMGSGILPQQTKDSFRAWARDLDNLGIK